MRTFALLYLAVAASVALAAPAPSPETDSDSLELIIADLPVEDNTEVGPGVGYGKRLHNMGQRYS